MSDDNIPIKQRLHITFGKHGPLKYTSNLDVAKIWERALRRAQLPILYTQGFNARARIQLASALPLGITSECEILDVSLRESIELDGLVERLAAVSPTGLTTYSIRQVPPRSPALQTLVRSAEYRIHFEDAVDQELLRQRIRALLAADEIASTRERKGKKSIHVDIRPLIYGLSVDESGDLIAPRISPLAARAIYAPIRLSNTCNWPVTTTPSIVFACTSATKRRHRTNVPRVIFTEFTQLSRNACDDKAVSKVHS
jgi:radical SAM-linked protein